MLDRFSRRLIRLYWFALRRPGITVAVVLGAVLFAAAGLPRLKNVSAARDLFEDTSPEARQFDEVAKAFDVGNPVLVFVRPRSGRWDG